MNIASYIILHASGHNAGTGSSLTSGDDHFSNVDKDGKVIGESSKINKPHCTRPLEYVKSRLFS